MEKDRVKLVDIPFLNATRKEFVNILKERLDDEKKTFVVTANPEILMKTKENARYKAVVRNADYVVADGIGVILLSKLKKTPLKERIAGFDLTEDLLEYANEKGLSIYLLGAKEEVNEKAALEIEKKYNNVKVVGRHHGYIGIKNREVYLELLEKEPDIVFVALGAPKQELFIREHIKKYNKGLFIGVGGSLDVHAKAIKRAPNIWIRLNLEWLYRMLKQPSRIVRNIKTFKFMIKELFKN